MVQAGLPESMQRRRKPTEKRLELSANKKRLIAEDIQSEKQKLYF